MATDIRRQAEDLIRYYSELVRRLPQHGVRDIPELLGLFEQVRGALGSISRQEIGWAAEQTQQLVEELVRMDAALQALRRLKATIERAHEPAGDSGGSGRTVP